MRKYLGKCHTGLEKGTLVTKTVQKKIIFPVRRKFRCILALHIEMNSRQKKTLTAIYKIQRTTVENHGVKFMCRVRKKKKTNKNQPLE